MRRGKEESQDYRMNYKFTTACKKAIKKHNCDQEAYTEGSFTKTTDILQCLNNLANQGIICVFNVWKYVQKFIGCLAVVQ